MIRRVSEKDLKQICGIYNYYIENTAITFEETPVSLKEMRNRVKNITISYPWYVYEEDEQVAGYTYARKWKDRYAYRFSVESTVYIKNSALGKGIGSKLYTKLLKELKNRNFHVIVAGISLPNDRSQRFHEKFGFVKVAYFSEVGYKFNKWVDVGYWELLLKDEENFS